LVAKELINTNAEIKAGLIHLLGNDIYAKDNTVDRKKLANSIFNDTIKLVKVNELIHPVVRTAFENWYKNQNSPYVIHEAAILFESGFYKMMDFTILVSASEEERIKRVLKRDRISEMQVKARIQKQWNDAEKRKLASIEIINDNSRLIIPEIIEIDKKLKEYGKIW
jgi:dephospho-CoA kinase